MPLKIPPSFNGPLWIVMAFFAIMAIVSYLNSDNLPKPSAILPALYQQPIQSETDREPFEHAYQGSRLTITPRYEYDLKGLVVSVIDHQAKSLFYENPFHFSKDVCVLWGGNLVKDDYRAVKYWSFAYMCFNRFDDASVHLDEKQLSNNHLLPVSADIDDQLRSVRVGDQIHLSGYLIDYTEEGQDWKVETSVTRDDVFRVFNKKNKGNCEVVLVQKLEILQSGGSWWRLLLPVWILLFVAAILVKFAMMHQEYEHYEEDFRRRTRRS